MSYSPEFHKPINQGQGNEILATILPVVQKQPAQVRSSKFHGDAHGVIGLHHFEGQVGLPTKTGDEVSNGCRGRMGSGWGEESGDVWDKDDGAEGKRRKRGMSLCIS